MIRARSRGSPAFTWVTEGGMSLKIEEMTEKTVSPLNGLCPVTI